MKVKVSKDYPFNSFLEEMDYKRLMRWGEDFTRAPRMNYTWEEKDVTIDELHEMIGKGYAIRINC